MRVPDSGTPSDSWARPTAILEEVPVSKRTFSYVRYRSSGLGFGVSYPNTSREQDFMDAHRNYLIMLRRVLPQYTVTEWQGFARDPRCDGCSR